MEPRLWKLGNAVLLKTGVSCAVKVLVAGVCHEEHRAKNTGKDVYLSYARVGRLLGIRDNERIKEVIFQAAELHFFSPPKRPSHVGSYQVDILLGPVRQKPQCPVRQKPQCPVRQKPQCPVRQKPQCPVRQKPQCPVRQKPHTLISTIPKGIKLNRKEEIRGGSAAQGTRKEQQPPAADRMTDAKRDEYVQALQTLKKNHNPH